MKAVGVSGSYSPSISYTLKAQNSLDKTIKAVRDAYAYAQYNTSWQGRWSGDHKPEAAYNLKQLLSAKYPEGLCCHFYDEFFGTLRSMIFDLDDGTADVCFGSPALNQWHRFKIRDEAGQTAYPVQLERKQAPADFYIMMETTT